MPSTERLQAMSMEKLDHAETMEQEEIDDEGNPSLKDKHRRVVNIETLIGFGWYQLFHIVTLKLMDFVEIVNMSFMIFAAEIPKITCLRRPLLGADAAPNPFDIVTDKEGVCGMILNQTCLNQTRSYTFYGIASEWDLTCDRVGIVYLSMSVQMIGVLLGAPTFGQISDLFGRKKAVLISLGCLMLVSGAQSFAPNWKAFVAFRFFAGFFTGGSITTGYVFRIEFIRPRHRVWVAAVASPLSYMYFSLLAYLTSSWRALALIGNLLGIIPYVMIMVCKESPRWLIQKGRKEDAKQVIRDIAKWNRDAVDEAELELAIEREMTNLGIKKGKKTFSFWHLFYSRKLTIYSMILPFAWFTVSCISYGIMFGITKLSGSPYINSLIYGGFRMVISLALTAGDLFVVWCGRKVFHGTGATVITICCTTLFAIFVAGSNLELSGVVRGGALLAATFASPLWLTVYLYSAELYPTPIRNLANSFCSSFARLGGIVAPQILFLSEYWAPATYLSFMVLAVIDGILFQIFLPETKGKPLPEQMPPKEEKLKCLCC